ncbi:hypothetical protein PYW08_016592 [Mythimna loreyi]|uniref:Uncharacterized protein n=1 Tax=Mythimna loreyi TaxID=667449 RepID=A0ACC2QZV2_9NEOP|nr:hypothetical protein PYW08_016592 [Mythimna loreyi]
MEKYFLALALTLLYPLLANSLEEESNFVFELKDAPAVYRQFAKRYNRTFKSEYDYNQRYTNFVQTLRYINSINSQGDTLQKVLPNQFADYSDNERVMYLRQHFKHVNPDLKQFLRMNDDSEDEEDVMDSDPEQPKIDKNGVRIW